MLANPPFGVEWKQQRYIEQERDTLGFGGRFGAGMPRVNDGALLFLQHMLSKMRAVWVLSNQKQKPRKGKVQLIDARWSAQTLTPVHNASLPDQTSKLILHVWPVDPAD